MGRRFAAGVTLTLSLAVILVALGGVGPAWIRGRDSASAAVTEADLSITKTDSKDPVAFFEPFTYTVRVDNAGPQGAAHVGVSDFLPAGLGVVSMDSNCQFVEGQMYCELGNIAGGGHAEAHFIVQAEASAPATIENHATINATENVDPNPGNNEAIETTTVSGTPPPSADLKLGLTDSKDPVTVGEALTYSLAIGNEGPEAGAEVEAVAVLPLSLEVKSADSGCSTAGGTIHCVLATLAPGATATRQFTVVPTQAGKVSVNASVSAKGSHDPIGANNSAVQTTEVQAVPTGPPVEPLRLRVNPEAPASPRGKFAILDLAISGPSTETIFKVDGSPAFHTDPGAPFVGFRFATVGVHTVTTTLVGIGGKTVSTSTPLIIRPGSTSTARPTFFPDIAVAASNPSLISGGPAAGACVPDSTVYFGAVEAKGCFRKVATADDIPPAERAAASEYVSTNILIENAQFANRCRFGDITCHFNPNALRIADPNLKPFVATGAVHVNGMTVQPQGGASIVVFPAISRLISSNARISYDGSVFGSIPVKKGPLNLDLNSGIKRFTDGDAEVPLFSFDTSQAFKDVGGFPINGKVEIVFRKKAEQRATALKLNISLPEQITTAAQADPTAKVEVLADNQRGTYLGFLNFHMNEAFLGPVELQNVDFTYNDSGEPAQGCARKWWKATAEVFFIPVSEGDEGAGIKMAPEPQRNGVAFCAGGFHSAGADLHFGYPIPPPEILPGVTLNEIGFDFQLQKPVLFDGFATIKAAEIVTATGGFLTAFASPQHPYTFKPGDAGGALHLLAGKTYTSTTIALGGRVFIEPEEDIELELGSAYILYSYPDYIIAHGSAHLQTFLFAINAEANFEASSRTRKFNALLAGEVCLAGGVKVAHVGACLGGEARVSSRGLSVCFNVLDGTWTPGVGELYGHLPEFFLGTLGDGCKPSHFWEANVRADRAAASGAGVPGTLTFHVKSGEKAKNIELVGAGGAPAVTIRGPGGESLVSQPNLMLHQGRLSAMSADAYSRTWLGIEDAKPGTYRVIPQPGSVPIANVRETHYEPGAAVKASVSGKGRHLVLSYDAGHAKGQKVSFFERGKGTWELLKSVSGGKGKVAFQPSFGPGGRRSIAAQVEVDGIPAPLQTLAHFKAPPPPRAGRVKGVHVSRHGSRLVASWSKVAFAQGYAVVVEEQGGLVRSLRVDGKRNRVTLKGISASEAGRVEVVAFGPLGDRGKPGHARFKATRKQTTRLFAYKELGYASPFVGELGPKHGGRRSHR